MVLAVELGGALGSCRPAIKGDQHDFLKMMVLEGEQGGGCVPAIKGGKRNLWLPKAIQRHKVQPQVCLKTYKQKPKIGRRS